MKDPGQQFEPICRNGDGRRANASDSIFDWPAEVTSPKAGATIEQLAEDGPGFLPIPFDCNGFSQSV